MLSKERKRRILLRVVPWLGQLFIRLLYATCRHRYDLPRELPEGPVIVAFWHGNMLFQPFFYRRLRPNRKVFVIISEHFDGKLISKTIEFFGIGTVAGSSSRGGARAVIESLRRLREGDDLAVTPDGPRGPRHHIADGIVMIAQKSDRPVLWMQSEASRAWRLSSWDGFAIPKPFSTIRYSVSVPLDLRAMTLEEARQKLENHAPEV